jgi:hypothetical protein
MNDRLLLFHLLCETFSSVGQQSAQIFQGFVLLFQLLIHHNQPKALDGFSKLSFRVLLSTLNNSPTG